MNFHANLVLACLWILLSFVAGLILGLNFHKDDWLGGYGSFKRRMYRLAHIAFFALGILNLLFFMMADRFAFKSNSASIASWGFVIGAVTMPACCLLVASFPKMRNVFALPIISLITAATITFVEVVTL